MKPSVSVPNDTVSSLGRAVHDIGLGAMLGGNLFARVGMHPSLAEIADERERGRVLNRSWQRYGPVNGVALAAVTAGWAGARLGEARPSRLSERERKLALAKDGAVLAAAATGLAAMAQGIKFSKQAADGAVPVQSGDKPSASTPPDAARMKRTVSVFGSLHLGSVLVLAGLDAALGQVSFRRPPARRLLRRRF